MNQSKPAVDPYKEWKKQLKRHYRKFARFAEEAYRFEDSEDVHQARVRCRKLLTLLKLLDPKDSEELRAPLRRAFKALGKVRDSDVLAADFQLRKEQAPDWETAELIKRFLKVQKDRREKAIGRLEGRLRPVLRKKFRRRWERYLKGSLEAQAQRADASRALQELQTAFEAKERELQRLKSSREEGGPEVAHTLHEARLIVKEVRYITEEAGFAMRQPVAGALSDTRVESLQEQLGQLNDSRVRLQRWSEVEPEQFDGDPELYSRMTDRLRGELERRIRHVELLPGTGNTG